LFTYDREYNGYVADVPELPGCMSQGKTLDEAVENIRDAIRGYLHVLDQRGTPYTQSGGGSFVGEVAYNQLEGRRSRPNGPRRSQRRPQAWYREDKVRGALLGAR
jgi:predicted RNase H-like HicB family nuclease